MSFSNSEGKIRLNATINNEITLDNTTDTKTTGGCGRRRRKKK